LGSIFFLRRRIATDDALVPAYQLRDSLIVLKKKVSDAAEQSKLALPGLSNAIQELETQLAPKSLEQRLPSAVVLPWSSGPAWQDAWKAYLTTIADKTGALVVLVNSGVQFAMGHWEKFPGPVATALGKIDALATTTSSPSAAQVQLGPIIQALQAVINPQFAATLTPMLQAAPSAVSARFLTLPPDTFALQVRLVRNTLWVWWLVALVALVGGYYAVVLQNFGFGSSTDFLKCFFWGLGFSVAGTQLDQLTQTTISGNFGVTIPKA
jgi:hypothetical protein